MGKKKVYTQLPLIVDLPEGTAPNQGHGQGRAPAPAPPTGNWRIICGSAHDIPLDDESVQCIVTSPPYYGLRSYEGEQAADWPAVEYSPMVGLPSISIPAMSCPLGHEPTLEAYIGHLVLCLREWGRVLRPDGTLWLNIGDSFASKPVGSFNGGGPQFAGRDMGGVATSGAMDKAALGIPAKNMLLVPARFALAAQAERWVVRNDIIWAKGVSFCDTYSGSARPESARDRCSNTHEYMWLLSKRGRYFYDQHGVKEDSVTNDARKLYMKGQVDNRGNGHDRGGGEKTGRDGKKRNLRSVWVINPARYPESHYAVFPPDLIEPAIRAGTSRVGACATCGAPWRRLTKREAKGYNRYAGQQQQTRTGGAVTGGTERVTLGKTHLVTVATVGWKPSCACDDPRPPVPCIVLDPFAGSGTTLAVATALGCNAVGIEIAQKYIDEHAPGRIAAIQDQY